MEILIDKFPSQHCNLLYFRRSVETSTRGCQNYSIWNTQDILNILTGSLLDYEEDGRSGWFARKRKMFRRMSDR